jgi:pimeloyl-ACP methyl ester carboxylesterase
MTVEVIALPGGVMPAAQRYQSLSGAVAGTARIHAKDLEVYAGEKPPAGYSIAMEVEALARFADSIGLQRFHLLGYSGGGFVSLAFAATHPERLLSLAIFEPASIPGRLTAEEADFYRRLKSELSGLTGAGFLQAFVALQVREGVTVPPAPGSPPPWMATRPAGLAAMMAAFEQYPFERDWLRRCDFHVFVGYGDLTGVHEEVRAGILSRLFPDIHVHRFTGIHHFVPPEQIYTPEHVELLCNLWTGARRPVAAS